MLFCVCWCRFNEPTSVKHIKMDLLPLVANDANTAEIVAELAEYVSDVNADMARHAIRGIAQVRACCDGGLVGESHCLTTRLSAPGDGEGDGPVLCRLLFGCRRLPTVSSRRWWTSSTTTWTMSNQRQ